MTRRRSFPRRTGCAAVLLLAACGSPAAPPPPPVRGPELVPPPADVTRADLAAATFAYARTAMTDLGVAPPAQLAEVRGRPVYLCAWAPGGARCAHGDAPDLVAAIAAAARGLHHRHGAELAAHPRGRFTVDFQTARRRVALEESLAVDEVGLLGLAIGAGDQRAFLVPAELLTAGLVRTRDGQLRWARLQQALQARNPDAAVAEPGMDAELFTTVSWLERPGAAPLRLRRLHPDGPPALDPDALLQRAVWAGDHLAAITGPDGGIRYHYDVDRDRVRDGINIIRHAGTIYAMLQAFDRTRAPAIRAAAERAIEFLLRHTEAGRRQGPHGGGDARFVLDEDGPGAPIPLGGSALAVVALVQYQEATGDARWLPQARALARFLVAHQEADGHFQSHIPYRAGDRVDKADSVYYPGEAILGLVRLYALDRDPLWLATARRGADWLIDVRDRGKGPDQLVNDHWLMIALSHLHLRTRDPRYLDHSLRIARAVEREYRLNAAQAARHPDFLGSYYVPPRSTPAATRAEGLLAVLDTCALAGRDCAWVDALLRDTLAHVLLSQYGPDQLFWVPDPAATAGGVAGGITDTSIRNDYVQHALSAILGCERLWRRAAGGPTLPGGPTWPDDPARKSWTGVPAADLHALRAPLR